MDQVTDNKKDICKTTIPCINPLHMNSFEYIWLFTRLYRKSLIEINLYDSFSFEDNLKYKIIQFKRILQHL